MAIMGRLYIPTWSLVISVCGMLLLWCGAVAHSDNYMGDKGSLRCPGIGTNGDGFCDATLNNELCKFDGGDCCSCTCIDGPEHTCGAGGYDCIAVNCEDYTGSTNSTPAIAPSSSSITGAQLVTGIVLSLYGYTIFGGAIGIFLWYLRRLCLGNVSASPVKAGQGAPKLSKVVNFSGLPTTGGEAGKKRMVAGGGEVKGEEPNEEDVETGFSRSTKVRPSARKSRKASVIARLQTTGDAEEKRPDADGGEVKGEKLDEADIEAGLPEGGETCSVEAGAVNPTHENAAGVEGDRDVFVADVQAGFASGEGGADSEDAEPEGGAVERKTREEEVDVEALSVEEIGDEEGVDTEVTAADVNSRMVEKTAGIEGGGNVAAVGVQTGCSVESCAAENSENSDEDQQCAGERRASSAGAPGSKEENAEEIGAAESLDVTGTLVAGKSSNATTAVRVGEGGAVAVAGKETKAKGGSGSDENTDTDSGGGDENETPKFVELDDDSGNHKSADAELEGIDEGETPAVEKQCNVDVGEVREGGAEQSAGQHIYQEEKEGKVLVIREAACEGGDEIDGESADVGADLEEIGSSVDFSAQENSRTEIGYADKSRHADQVANTE